MHRGYIKLWRKMLDDEIMTNNNYLIVWINLLLMANYKKKTIIFNGKSLTLEAGQLITGREKLAAICGITSQKSEQF